MRQINNIVIHCTATPQTATIDAIKKYWKNVMKWKSYGYHFIIEATGNIVNITPIEQPSNGVAGHNQNSIHISYIGGVDHNGIPKDTRTASQLIAMEKIVRELKAKFPDAKICGHRDFPGVHKACPSFDVAKWLKDHNI